MPVSALPAHHGNQVATHVTVALVDSVPILRSALPLLANSITITHSFGHCDEFLQVRPTIDVVVIDPVTNNVGNYWADRGSGPDRVRRLAAHGYRICIYTSDRRVLLLLRCLKAGAAGIVHKSEPIHCLETAVATIAAGGRSVSAALPGLAQLAKAPDGPPSLSPRQQQVLSARARGERYRSIAARLAISEKTVQEYMTQVVDKYAKYLTDHSAADLEHTLGLAEDVTDELSLVVLGHPDLRPAADPRPIETAGSG